MMDMDAFNLNLMEEESVESIQKETNKPDAPEIEVVELTNLF